jgi:uncharacterized protein (DUF885 family)
MSYPTKPATLVIAAALVWLCAAAPQVAADEADASDRLNDWFDEQFEADLERSPATKTRLGIIDGDYGTWDDLSLEFREESFRIGQRQLEEMRERFDYEALDEQTQLSWRLFEFNKEQEKAAYRFREHTYTFNQMFGPQSGIPAFLINEHRVSEAAHAEAYIERLRGVEAYLEQALTNARRRMAAGHRAAAVRLRSRDPRCAQCHQRRAVRRSCATRFPLLADFKSQGGGTGACTASASRHSWMAL